MPWSLLMLLLSWAGLAVQPNDVVGDICGYGIQGPHVEVFGHLHQHRHTWNTTGWFACSLQVVPTEPTSRTVANSQRTATTACHRAKSSPAIGHELHLTSLFCSTSCRICLLVSIPNWYKVVMPDASIPTDRLRCWCCDHKRCCCCGRCTAVIRPAAAVQSPCLSVYCCTSCCHCASARCNWRRWSAAAAAGPAARATSCSKAAACCCQPQILFLIMSRIVRTPSVTSADASSKNGFLYWRQCADRQNVSQSISLCLSWSTSCST